MAADWAWLSSLLTIFWIMVVTQTRSARIPVMISVRARSRCPSSLPFRGDADAKAFWNRTVGKGDWTEDDLATAMTYVRETGALADTQKAAHAEIEAATEALDVFGDSPMRAALRDVARFVVERQT